MRTASIRTVLAALLLSMIFLPGRAASQVMSYFDQENLTERRDGYFTMRDRADGTVIMRTARILHAGNEYLDRLNRHFRVVSIEEDSAWAELIEASAAETKAGTAAVGADLPVQGERRRPKVGIYHSHGAESYVPSDGAESIEQGGGIMDVGERLSESLEEEGVETIHEWEPHVPHDAGAYNRSRRTAEELLVEKDADILIDVHRDAVPAEEYEEEVAGQPVTQILLVVGQQNQNAGNNWQMARDLKEIADRRYPGLVKGILAAPGSYNQDLMSRAILIEVGSHENNKEDAERAVSMFGDVVSEYMTGEAAPGREEEMQTSRFAASSVLKVLAVVAGALFVYLLIAAGSWEEFKRKTASFFRKEFADLRRGFGRENGDDQERR